MEQFYVKPLGLEEYPAPDVAIFEILGMRFVIAYAENGEEVFVQEDAVAMTLESQKKAKPKTANGYFSHCLLGYVYGLQRKRSVFIYPGAGEEKKRNFSLL